MVYRLFIIHSFILWYIYKDIWKIKKKLLIKYEFNNKYFSLTKLKTKLRSLHTRYPTHNLIFKRFITHFINQFQLAISTVKNKEFHVDAPFCITMISQFPCTSGIIVSQWYLLVFGDIYFLGWSNVSKHCWNEHYYQSWLYTDLTKLEWLYKLTHKSINLFKYN